MANRLRSEKFRVALATRTGERNRPDFRPMSVKYANAFGVALNGEMDDFASFETDFLA